MLHIYVKKINVFVAISPAAAWSLPSVNYCCGHWTTGVIIELLCGHWTDCLFWTIHTKHANKKDVSSIRLIDVPVVFVQTPLSPFRKNRSGRVFPFATYPSPAPYLMLGEGGLYTG